jgi:uncharacterized protein (TIGR02001 family)
LRLAFGGLAAVTALGAATAASAQLGASVSVQSDYRYRGRSLSEVRPTVGLNVSYDHGSGAYAGASLIAVDAAEQGLRTMGYASYVGYVRRPPKGPAWDVGATHSKINYYEVRERSVRYTEYYTGLLTDHASVRVYYSPSYFGQGGKTVYLDLGGAFRPAPDWRVFGHLGVLRALDQRTFQGSSRERYDVSAGVATKLKDVELTVSVTSTSPRTDNPSARKLERNAVVLGATYYF